MNLNTITEVKRPTSADQITDWRDGYAWLGGGTWLFSEPQIHTDTLIDLDRMGWPALTPSDSGLEIAATCRIADIFHFQGPAQWRALPLFKDCCNSLLASFKIWNAATVGGNLCMSLPAGAMIALTSALEGTCTLWPRGGAPRQVPVLDFVTGVRANVLQRGELLRSIHLPAAALKKRYALRQGSLVHLGRSAALLIGTVGQDGADFRFTMTAATPRPVQLSFPKVPSAAELEAAIDRRLPDTAAYFDDVNGSAAYKRHLTHYYGEQIRQELA